VVHRKHPRLLKLRLIDALVALPLTVGGLADIQSEHHERLIALALVSSVASTTSVAWRRRAPAIASIVAASALLVLTLIQSAHANSQLAFEPIAMGLDFYLLGRAADDRSRSIVAAGIVCFAVAASALGAVHQGGQTAADVISGSLIFIGLPATLGNILTRRKSLATALAATADALEREQRVKADRAADQERSRMARELHDVIAHDLSVMVIQTSAARRTLLHDRAAVRVALGVVIDTGRDALEELRRITGVVRSEGEPTSAAPGLSQLNVLVARTQATGMMVELSIEGSSVTLPPGLDLIAYRVIQEALTNSLKHAGPATARVRVTFGPEALELEISDTGIGRQAPKSPLGGSGYGLMGMRERVGLFGGELQAGPKPTGGFVVQARLPLIEALG
jgi:signal transduction histidine kinase